MAQALAPPPNTGLNPDTSLQLPLSAQTEIGACLDYRSRLWKVDCLLKQIRSDLSQVLEQVEETEQRLDRHAVAIRSLQTTTRNLSIAQKMAVYKIKDQENRNRQNIQIRGLPEATRDVDLPVSFCGIFNGLLSNPSDHPLKLNQVHWAFCTYNLSSDTPRDMQGSLL